MQRTGCGVDLVSYIELGYFDSIWGQTFTLFTLHHDARVNIEKTKATSTYWLTNLHQIKDTKVNYYFFVCFINKKQQQFISSLTSTTSQWSDISQLQNIRLSITRPSAALNIINRGWVIVTGDSQVPLGPENAKLAKQAEDWHTGSGCTIWERKCPRSEVCVWQRLMCMWVSCATSQMLMRTFWLFSFFRCTPPPPPLSPHSMINQNQQVIFDFLSYFSRSQKRHCVR